MSDVRLNVNGRRYGGWKGIRITRSIESAAGSFELDVSDRWGGQEELWPITEEDECQVQIDGETVIDGWIDRREIALSATERRLTYAGRDKAAVLVDCSAVLDRWSFRNATVQDIAREVCRPFGISVSLQPGLILPAPHEKLVVNPGDSAFSVIERAAVMAGVLVVSDGAGGLQITRSGTGRAPVSLIQGQDMVLAASVDYDATQRFSQYVVATQTAGSDTTSGNATRVRATADDEGVQRTDRVLMVLPEAGASTAYARQRADWEARIRAARAETVTMVVRGWRAGASKLWPLNALIAVRFPAVGVDGDLLITSAEHSLDDGGEVTTLRLMRPDAFAPEPVLAKVKRAGGLWKEIRDGGL